MKNIKRFIRTEQMQIWRMPVSGRWIVSGYLASPEKRMKGECFIFEATQDFISEYQAYQGRN